MKPLTMSKGYLELVRNAVSLIPDTLSAHADRRQLLAEVDACHEEIKRLRKACRAEIEPLRKLCAEAADWVRKNEGPLGSADLASRLKEASSAGSAQVKVAEEEVRAIRRTNDFNLDSYTILERAVERLAALPAAIRDAGQRQALAEEYLGHGGGSTRAKEPNQK